MFELLMAVGLAGGVDLGTLTSKDYVKIEVRGLLKANAKFNKRPDPAKSWFVLGDSLVPVSEWTIWLDNGRGGFFDVDFADEQLRDKARMLQDKTVTVKGVFVVVCVSPVDPYSMNSRLNTVTKGPGTRFIVEAVSIRAAHGKEEVRCQP